jgi:hypothetical protein
VTGAAHPIGVLDEDAADLLDGKGLPCGNLDPGTRH